MGKEKRGRIGGGRRDLEVNKRMEGREEVRNSGRKRKSQSKE